MSSISIIGSGNMASAIGAPGRQGRQRRRNHRSRCGQGRSPGQANSATAPRPERGAPHRPATSSSSPCCARSAVPVVSQYGDALAGKIIVDITNPFNASGTGLAIPADTSIAQMVAEAAPASTHVVKAFNTLFRDVLAAGGPVDVFMAGDDPQAKASVSAFVKSLGLRPQDVGDLSMAHWVEAAGLLTMGLARNGVGHFDFSLGVNLGGAVIVGKLDGKVAVITGATSGMALAGAKLFVDEGAHVFISGRRKDALDEAVELIGRNVTGVQGDSADLDDLDRLFDTVKQEKGAIDVLWASAGAGKQSRLGEITEERVP